MHEPGTYKHLDLTEDFPTKKEVTPGRGKSYRRDMRERHIERKRKIIRKHAADSLPAAADATINPQDLPSALNPDSKWNVVDSRFGSCSGYWYYKHRGQLSKGKIHCSCPMCSFFGPTQQDIRALGSMESEIDDALIDMPDITKEAISSTFVRIKHDAKPAKKTKGRGLPGTSLGKDTQTGIYKVEQEM